MSIYVCTMFLKMSSLSPDHVVININKYIYMAILLSTRSLFNKDGGVSTVAYLAEISAVGMVFVVVHVNAPCMDCVLFLYYQVSPKCAVYDLDLIANVDHACSIFLFSEPSVSVVV
jgi:hypothetical protein